MLETPQQIAFCLLKVGENIVFDSKTIPPIPPALDPTVVPSYTSKAIPGDTVYNIQNYDGIYDIEKQDFIFRTSEQLIILFNIVVGDSFTYSRSNTSGRTHKFTILSIISDSTGWVAVKCKLTGVV